MGRDSAPALAWAGFLISMLEGVIALQRGFPVTAPGRPPVLAPGPGVLSLLAYLVAFWFAVRIPGDHPEGSAMRRAWRLIVWSCAMGMIRYVMELAAPAPLVGLRQAPNVLHLGLLLAGLVVTWSAFRELRMGVRLTAAHWAAVGAILVLAGLAFSMSGQLPDSGSVFPAIRFLQLLATLLIFAGALLGVVLHRISQEIGGGELAGSMRAIVAFLLLRPVIFVVRFSLASGNPGAAVILLSVANASVWLLTLGVIYRWRLTERAAEMAERYV